MTEFEAKVAKVVKAIPRGQTFSYARVALFANKPGAARAVVRALRVAKAVPWWRVIRSDGTLAPQVALQQARKLRAEGVEVKGRRVVTTKVSARAAEAAPLPSREARRPRPSARAPARRG